jgi:hypothetical protein
MSETTLETEDGRTAFQPGETIAGRGRWSLDDAPRKVAVHLLCYTRGKGTEDVRIVRSEIAANPDRGGSCDFEFTAPQGPYSCDGKLISLIWALELVIEGGRGAPTQRVDLTISPDGRPLRLAELPKDSNQGWMTAS